MRVGLKNSQRGAAGFGAEPQYHVGGICAKRKKAFSLCDSRLLISVFKNRNILPDFQVFMVFLVVIVYLCSVTI